MSYLTIGGYPISIAKGTTQISRVKIGNESRAFSGAMIRDIRAHKLEARFETTPLDEEDFQLLQMLLDGLVGSSDLVLFDGFESGVSVFNGDTAYVASSGAQYYGGFLSALLTLTTGTAIYTTGETATPGVYCCEFWLYGTSGRQGRAYFYDADNAQTGPYTTYQDNGAWQLVRCFIELEEATTDLRVYFAGLLPLSPNHYIDNLQITRQAQTINVGGEFLISDIVGPIGSSISCVGSIDAIVAVGGHVGGTHEKGLRKVAFTVREI